MSHPVPTMDYDDAPEEQIVFGQCACGEYGQLFRTGKCAHCYIEELEGDVRRLSDKVLAL